MHRYQNVSDSEQIITAECDVQPRKVAPGAETLSSAPIENPNFKYLGESEPEDERGSGHIEAVQERSPTSITGPANNDEGVQE